MSIKWSICVLLLWAGAALSDEPVRLVLSSASDFTDISVTLKKAENPDPAYVAVNVTLTPEAKARTRSLSLLTYKKYMTLYVDGYQLSTAMVQSEMGGQLSFVAPRALVIEWMSQFSREASATQPTM